ncbi:hypothetical protein [Flavisericum labens]|uniref:hypothetical protein n=1 Tax=Flavisericum labens TaxID=3377112 RepID=UPI00387A8809
MKKEVTSINLKLSDELKEKVKNRAGLRKQTISKYVRELLSNYFDGSLCKGEIIKNEKKEFINSTDFLQLIVWIYSKRRSNTFKEQPGELEGYIGTLKKTADHFPKHLVLEFDKVLLDLIRVQNVTTDFGKDYKFADGYSYTPNFNFEILEKYLLNYSEKLSFLI